MSTDLKEPVTPKTEPKPINEGFERRPKDAWMEIIGSQTDDELFREAVRLGAEWRAKANAEGR